MRNKTIAVRELDRIDYKILKVLQREARLELAHPLTGERLALESALPADLAAFLAGLPQEVRRGAAL